MADANMLEHADRDDAVERLRHVAIVLQTEVDLVVQSLFGRALARARVLLLRERDAGDVRAAELGQIERKPAPAAADVEHALVPRDEQLGREMTLLGELGIVERLAAGLEIGAAVLPVGIEEQRIELTIEIVMMGDVALRPRPRIELLQAAIEIADEPLRLRPQRRRAVAALAEHDGEDVGDRALLDDDAAIHIGFAEPELGIDQDVTLRRPRGKADRHRRAGPVPEGKSCSPRGRDPKIPRADQLFQRHPKQPIHRPPPPLALPRPRHNWRPPASLRTDQAAVECDRPLPEGN